MPFSVAARYPVLPHCLHRGERWIAWSGGFRVQLADTDVIEVVNVSAVDQVVC